MSKGLDWLSLIKSQGPDVPESIRNFISKSDEAFRRGEGATSAQEELVLLDTELSSSLYEQLRVSLGAHAAILQRQLVLAIKNDQSVEQCFGILKQLFIAGFSSAVEKSRIVIVLLEFLEDRLTPQELMPLIDAMADELESCRIGCEENLSVLKSFVKDTS